MIKRVLFSLFFLSAIGCSTLLKTKESHLPLVNKVKFSDDINVFEYKLPNKLTILLIPNKNAPLVSVNHWVKAGSLHEKRGISGIAHLFEHMMFRALNNDKKDFREKAAALGAEVGANTRFGSTFYHSTVPSKNIDQYIGIEAKRFKNLRVTDDLLNIERKAVWSEYSMMLDANPEVDLWVNTYYQGYRKNHPYSWMIIGDREDLPKITAKDCNNFFQKYYRPNNIGIIISGNFNKDKVLQSIVKNYGNWEAGLDTKLPPIYNHKSGLVKVRGNLPSKARYVMLAHRIPKTTPTNYDLLEFVNYVLYFSKFSVANRELQIKRKLVSNVEEFNFHYDRGTLKALFTLYDQTSLKTLLEQINGFKEVIRKMDDKEFNAYKKSYQIQFSELMLKNTDLAEWISLGWGKYDSYENIARMRNKGLNVTKKQVMSFLTKYYTNQNLIVSFNKTFKE